MKTIQVGQPIEIDEKTASLLDLISEGRWENIDREVLRSICPDTNLFVRFLERHNLKDTEEAKVVLSRLGIEATEPELAMAAGAVKKRRGFRLPVRGRALGRTKASAKKRRGFGVLVKHRAAGRGKIAARKKMRKAKRRKRAKSRKK